MESAVHSLIHSFIHFMGFYCALKCVGTVLRTEKVKMSKTQPRDLKELPALQLLPPALHAGREREHGSRQGSRQGAEK